MPQITLYIDTLPEPSEDLFADLWVAYTEAIAREDYTAAKEYKKEMDKIK